MLELERPECLRLLAGTSGRVGRVCADVPGSAPILRPVNYLFDGETQSVVFRSAPGSALHRLLRSSTAVFEIDGGDPVERTGWSVIVVGDSEEVTDLAEIGRLDELELEPWAPGPKVCWVRIRVASAAGRRIVRGPDVVPGHGA